MINIRDLAKGRLLKALYNNAKPQGVGVLVADAQQMTEAQAIETLLVDCRPDRFSFDYLRGRVMKVDLSGDYLDETLYDRDNGPGAAARAIRGEFGK